MDPRVAVILTRKLAHLVACADRFSDTVNFYMSDEAWDALGALVEASDDAKAFAAQLDGEEVRA